MAEKKPYFISPRQPNNITSFPFLRKQAYENKLTKNMNVFESVLVSVPNNDYSRKKKNKKKTKQNKTQSFKHRHNKVITLASNLKG